MKKGTNIILIIFCSLVFFFCLSGVMMIGSSSVAAPLEQKEHYLFVLHVYETGVALSFLAFVYLIFFQKVIK
jgi:putative lipase involved disintegration of autophagic bodies